MVETFTAFTCDPIAGSNPGGGSVPSSGVALTRVYTVIPFKEQTPQLGQIGRELGVYSLNKNEWICSLNKEWILEKSEFGLNIVLFTHFGHSN